MQKNKLLELVKNAKDDEDINSLLVGTDIESEFKSSGITLDAFKGKMKDKDFKAYIDSLNDKHFEKALETWKTNNLEKELEPFIQEKYPDLVTDPVQKELNQLKKQLADEQKANARKDLLNQAIQYAAEKKIPSSLVEKFLDEDLEKTKTNLDGFIETINPWVQEQVDTRLGQHSWTPGIDNGNTSKGIGEILAAEFNNTEKVEGPNPWA